MPSNLQSPIWNLESPLAHSPTAPPAASTGAHAGASRGAAPGQTTAAKLGPTIAASHGVKRQAELAENPARHYPASACAPPGQQTGPLSRATPGPNPDPKAAQCRLADTLASSPKSFTADVLADTAADLLVHHPAFLSADYHRSTSLFVVIHQPVNLPMFDNHVDFCYNSPFGETGTKTERL